MTIPARGFGFEPGTLRKALAARTRQALACGALQPIRTKQAHLQDGPIRFLVRVISTLAHKARVPLPPPAPSGNDGRPANPFLPYDPALFVADISRTHVGLLNKFPVMEDHLLIVTREFEHQEMVLTRADFEALWHCLAEFDGLAFYNGGADAGASQPHKHLQIVPLPLAEGDLELPIAALLQKAGPRQEDGTLPAFPFRHRYAQLRWDRHGSPVEEGRAAHRCYLDLLAACGLEGRPDGRQNGAYNLLATRHWMLVVPRSREFFEGVSINALGFVGSLFVRNAEELERLRQHHPLHILSEVAQPMS